MPTLVVGHSAAHSRPAAVSTEWWGLWCENTKGRMQDVNGVIVHLPSKAVAEAQAEISQRRDGRQYHWRAKRIG